MPPLPATRLQFLGPRLALTGVLLASLLGAARFVWYPGLSFTLSGIPILILVISGVAIILGPGLSTLVYRPHKKGLHFDLAAILLVEVVAIALAAGALHERRPFFLVFAVDRFELVAAGEVNWEEIGYDGLRDKPSRAPRLVYAQLPEDPAALSALMHETVFAGGPDIDRRPKYWHPYEAGVASVIQRAIPLETLAAGGGAAAKRVARWVAGQPGDIGDYAYLPVRGKEKDGAIVLHRQIGYPLAMLNVDPW